MQYTKGMNYFWLYLIIIPLLGLFDFAWIGSMHGFYKSQMGALLTSSVVWWAAILFYFVYAAALLYFVIHPAITAHSFIKALVVGFFFGLVAFATYDLTNVGTTAGWPVALAFIDMAYGAVEAAVVSGIVYSVATGFLGF